MTESLPNRDREGAARIRILCPICKKPVTRADIEFPFCSERCRVVDLGNWASEKYVVSTPIESTPEHDED